MKRVSSKFQWYIMDVSRFLLKSVSEVFQVGFTIFKLFFKVFLFLTVCFKGVLKNLKGALRMFPGCFMGISKRFKEVSNSMALIAATRAEGGLVTLKLAELDHEI